MTPTPFEREIYALRRQGIKYDLERMRTLTARLGHPERRYTTLHVAGTNGKGSAAAMLAAGLTAAGYTVGLNTSPHLVSFRERIRVGGRALPDPVLHDVFEELRAALEEVEASFFEASTALAFVAFARARVDVAVFEVGLGGRLDATNVIRSAAAIITRIDLEHTRILGSTRGAIAREKAGILDGQPVAVSADDRETLEAIAGTAERCGSELLPVRRGVEWELDGDALIDLATRARFRPALPGVHQAENAAVVLRLLEHLDRTGVLSVPVHARRAAVELVSWPGRFDVRETPGATVVFDVAHNELGARALVATVRSRYPDRRVAVVIGMLRDKAHAPFLRAVRSLTRTAWVTTPESEDRRMEAHDLATLCHQAGIDTVVEPDPSTALRRASRTADVVVVTGSLFTVGSVMRGVGIHPAEEIAGLSVARVGEGA